MPMSSLRSKPSMKSTISPSRADEIIMMMENDDFEGISLEEYMQVSFMVLMSSGELHGEEKVMYGGNLYTLHACVSQVNPNQQVSALRNVV